MSEACVVFSQKDGMPVAEIPLDDAAAFVAGVDSAMRVAAHRTDTPVWKLLQTLTCTAMLCNDGAVIPVKGEVRE